MSDKRRMHESRGKKNIEQKLPAFFEKAASVNHVYAGTSFVMQFYSFYESLADGERELTGEEEAVWNTVCRIVKENLLDGFDGEKREEAVRALTELRGTVTAKMQALTTYTDRFGLYEYMLNRIEPRFEERLAEPDDDAAAREILQYIFMEKDNVLINTRIHQMLSQLPVRMSRGRFEDMVRAGFENYVGMDTEAVDDFVYRIESVAGLYEPEGLQLHFPELAESLSVMRNADWKGMDEEAYLSTQAAFDGAAEMLETSTDVYYSLMELINLLYAWLLNFPYASAQAAAQTQELMPLLRETAQRALDGVYEPVPEELAGLLVKTEGVLEEFSMQLQKCQGILAGMDGETERTAAALMLEKQLVCLKISAVLLSGSLFADPDAKSSAEPADRAYLKEASDRLVEKLLAAFASQQTPHNRAMIAAVLSELPVFFNSQNEVMDYVRGSLSGCHETAEKAAGIRLMKRLMEE